MRLVPTIALLLAAALSSGDLDPARQWGAWRGPSATGAAPHADPPLQFGDDRNVRFRVEVPGRGLSSPVVWGDLLFLTTAVPTGEPVGFDSSHDDHGAHDNVAPTRRLRFTALAYDRRDGTLRWSRTLRVAQPHEATHETGSWASPSAVTDGRRLIVSFGSQGLYALSLAGELLWEADLGDMRVKHSHGEGSSPALHGDRVVVNWDHQGDSFLAALDAADGRVVWKVARDEGTSWSSPLVVEVGDVTQVVAAAPGKVRGYDLADGRLIWECAGLSGNVVATPVASDGIVVVANSYDTRAMMAIRLAGANGDLAGGDHVLWRRARDTPYVPSPAIHDGTVYFLKHLSGILTAVDLESGATRFGPVRLGGMRQVFASPVVAADRLYVAGRDGTVTVLRAGTSFEPLALNRLDDSFSASPAVVGDTLYLRGERSLWALAVAAHEKGRPEGRPVDPT